MRAPLPQFARGDRPPDRIAEVIETATTEFLAQCLEPDDLSFPPMPPFGSWVRAEDETSGNQVYAIVQHATTSPIDSVHRAQALGLSLPELRDQQPQVFAMLKTEFRAAIVGFATGPLDGKGRNRQGNVARVCQHLPPRPPQIHQPVYACTATETIRFTESFDFLRPLLQGGGPTADALVAATLREIYRLRSGDRDWLVGAGRALGAVLKDDYDRLRAILGQVRL